jgi:glycosyltransferase involved in cell wall biosynthesis
MNILHISTPVSWRGGEQQLAYLARELKNTGQEQFFMCAATGAIEAFCIENEFAFFGIKTGLVDMLSNASLLKRVCRNYKIDIIHTNDSKAHTIAYVAALLGNKIPVVVSRRVDFPVGKSLLSRKKYNHSSVKAIICVSNAIKEITGRSITNKTVLRVVYDGIDANTDMPVEIPDLKALFGFPADSIVIGNIAALAPHKDYFTWLDTAVILKERNPLMRFLIVGDGPQKAEIMAYLTKKGLQDVVVATGFREDAKELLWGFDVFLNTSETEGLGSSLLDAFVRRVPVVATEAGGIPEIVINENTGLLAPVKNPVAIANQVEKVVNDTHISNRLVENAYRLTKSFDKGIMAEKTLEIYKAVLYPDHL